MELKIREAEPSESDDAAGVILRSRRASVPEIPALVHSDHEVREWFRDVVMPAHHVWIAVADSPVNPRIVGVAVASAGWLEHLYVEPQWTGQGIGKSLLDVVKAESTGQLLLWTFDSNTGAQRFYERHGFAAVARTDGDNEEGAPDIKYQWQRGQFA